MLLLVTDTSGKQGFVALVRAGQEQADGIQVVGELPLEGGTFSALLVPQISELLEKHRFAKGALDAFVAVAGPGSFTGLRVGLAAIKALAEILQKPIVPVSLLEVVAIGGNAEDNLLAVLDAGRGEVYIGDYEVRGSTARCRSERLLPRGDFPRTAPGFAVCTPDRSLAQTALDAGLAVHHVTIDVETIARVGWRKLRDGRTVSSEQLEANYIRRSDAEIFSKTSFGQ